MSETQTDMSTSGDQQRQQVAEDDIDNLSLQRIYTRDFDDGAVRVSFQIIRLEKQVFVYVGLVHGDTLDSMSISVPMAQNDQHVSTIVLSKHDLNPDSIKLSRVLCSRTGMPVLASYNIPSGAVSETVKNDIITTCTQLVASQSC